MAVWLSPTLLARYLLTAVLVLGLTLGLHPGPGARPLSQALLPEPVQAALPNPLGGSNQAPPLGVQRVGVLEVSPVTLDGRELFEIASPAVFNREQPGQQVPVEVRAKQIEVNLNQVINQALNPAALVPEVAATRATPADFIEVTIETVNDLPVLFGTVDVLAEPRVLLTVTDSDAQYHGLSEAALAKRWAAVLQEAFQRTWASRQPEARQRQVQQLLLILLASLVLTLALAGSWQVLGWRKQALEQQQALEGQDHSTAANPARLPASPYRHWFSPEQRLQLVAFFRWLMFWGIAFVWIGGLAAILNLFPQTRRYASSLFTVPVLLLVTWFIASLLNRLANIGIDSIAQAWEKNDLGTVRNLEHRSMRISTIINAAKGVKTVLIYALALVSLLQILQLAPASVLAFSALAALALTFAAQNLVKDLVNGVLILLEDQYAIGDLITTGGTTGIVENLNLRITQIRGEDGRLVTLPNSLIAQVDNLSRNWSRAVITIDVAYGTDVDEALAVVRHTANAMAADPTWRSTILTPTEILGVNGISHAGLTLVLWMRTQPLKQYAVGREFRRRLRLALEQANITIGIPQQNITSGPEDYGLTAEMDAGALEG
ncbi:MAG: mechanosensitive ion channel family protein [Cyanobacteriota bacterium]|nr:mechanosensitive ion channel family protein [Cyanobacteriota bacterium]